MDLIKKCDFSVDDLDFFIIEEISRGNESTWDIAKRYFFTNVRKYKNKDIDSKNNLVKNRLKKMHEWGIVFISKNGDNKNVYHLIKEYFNVGKHKFQEGYFDSIQLKINGYWVVFQI